MCTLLVIWLFAGWSEAAPRHTDVLFKASTDPHKISVNETIASWPPAQPLTHDLRLEITPLVPRTTFDLDPTISLIRTYMTYLFEAHHDLTEPYILFSESVEISIEPSPGAPLPPVSCDVVARLLDYLIEKFEEGESAYAVGLRFLRVGRDGGAGADGKDGRAEPVVEWEIARGKLEGIRPDQGGGPDASIETL